MFGKISTVRIINNTFLAYILDLFKINFITLILPDNNVHVHDLVVVNLKWIIRYRDLIPIMY